MNTSSVPVAPLAGEFALHSLGYVRHWLVAGLDETPYSGPPGDETVLRREAIDPQPGEPPTLGAPGKPGPWGQPWRFHYPGQNYFVEHTAFFHALTKLDSYACTEIVSDRDVELPAQLWVAGTMDFWFNGAYVTRFATSRYMYPGVRDVVLPLRRGVNVAAVRLQCLGMRDTRMLFGLRLTAKADGISVRLPGEDAARATLVTAANWLDGVRTDGREMLVARGPAPASVEVHVPEKTPAAWPEGKTAFSLDPARPFQVSVAITAAGQRFQRQFEIPANRTPSILPPAGWDYRHLHLESFAEVSGPPIRTVHAAPPLFARRLLHQPHPEDEPGFDAVIRRIDRREDCADFGLAMLLRLPLLGLANPRESAEIRRAALAFRYWSDEPGTDAMCFWSENHSLLFHGCQRLAGLLWPDETFTNSGRTGTEQAALGLERCRAWLDHIEPRGFEEYLSGSYMPITTLALLNLADFAQDAEVSRRAAALIDRIFEDLATHSFRGVVVGPQGRVYRGVLYPERSGTQTLLSFATSEALATWGEPRPAQGERIGDWAVFLAKSPRYRPPRDLAERMRQPVSKRYPQGGTELVLHKTQDYLLTSIALPSGRRDAKGNPEGPQPGWGGYQQHVWQATLAPGCHVFVNHPGCSFDESKSRPGYWYGNGILPRLAQDKGTLTAIYSIPDGSDPYHQRTEAEWNWPVNGCPRPFDLHPIPFTHAHWPSDAFDWQEVRGPWAFGRKGTGYIALWCSAELQPYDDVLTGRELRAWGCRCAWVVRCGGEHESDFATFRAACEANEPRFDPATLTLSLEGLAPLGN